MTVPPGDGQDGVLLHRARPEASVDHQQQPAYAFIMERIARIGPKEIWLEVLARPYEFQSPFSGQEFVCILMANDSSITPAEQNHISDRIVAEGCRYAVCGGIDCSSSHDAVDWAHLVTDPDYHPPDETFVMTTWHEDESPAEVIWFGLHCTNFDQHDFTRYLLLLLGPDPHLENELREMVAKEAGDLSHQ